MTRANLVASQDARYRRAMEFSDFVRDHLPDETKVRVKIPPRLDAGPVLQALVAAGVDFVIIGGIAGALHGSSYPTYDLDVAYSRDPANLKRLSGVLAALDVKLNNAPEDLPFMRRREDACQRSELHL